LLELPDARMGNTRIEFFQRAPADGTQIDLLDLAGASARASA
jgi:hypothetical protein